MADKSVSRSRESLQQEFLAKLGTRLHEGARSYGDQSFYRDRAAREILDELLDVAGWAFVAWVQMRMRLEKLTLDAEELEDPDV